MKTSSVAYFDSPGPVNTDEVVTIVVDRVKKGGVKHVVVASGSGATAKKLIVGLKGTDAKLAVVSLSRGFESEDEGGMSPKAEEDLIKLGAKMVRATHVLSGVEGSISRKLGGSSRVETIAQALKSLFGQGMKVCVEITVMAADCGAIPCGDIEVIAVAGSDTGADTACVLRPAYGNKFFDMQVREILAMPRRK